MTAIDGAWLDAQIEKTKLLIIAYDDALLSLAGGAQSYMLDTGQTRQTVTKADIGRLQSGLFFLENRLSTLDARRCGSGTFYGRPGF